MINRMLTQEEFEKADIEGQWEGDYDPILAAQIKKIDNWWVEKMDLYTATINRQECILIPMTTWKQLKKEIMEIK